MQIYKKLLAILQVVESIQEVAVRSFLSIQEVAESIQEVAVKVFKKPQTYSKIRRFQRFAFCLITY